MTVKRSQSYDIIVVGSGITGLSAAYHLHCLGYRDILLISSDQCKAVSSQSAAFLAPGLPDNFTRLSHQLGLDGASEVWRAGDCAFTALKEFCLSEGIPSHWGRRWRLANSESEAEEISKAVMQLKSRQFDARVLTATDWQAMGVSLGTKISLLQEEGLGGGVLDFAALKSCLSRPKMARTVDHIEKIWPHAGFVEVLGKKHSYKAEMLVLAAHQSISDFELLPDESLVPFADQCHNFRVRWKQKTGLEVGTVFSIMHGYFWGVLREHNTICAGGGRFLRPLAGIGAETASLEPSICSMIQKELIACFPELQIEQVLDGNAAIEIRPCDEIPVIGPMFGEARILMATGYMGFGMTWGFWAGQMLAQLIDSGQAVDLPRRLWPERLRSMEV